MNNEPDDVRQDIAKMVRRFNAEAFTEEQLLLRFLDLLVSRNQTESIPSLVSLLPMELRPKLRAMLVTLKESGFDRELIVFGHYGQGEWQAMQSEYRARYKLIGERILQCLPPPQD